MGSVKEARLNADEIALTLPADDAFHRVAHLVLGGLATRHELTVETLDDLTLAVDTVLARYGRHEDDVTVRVRIGEEDVHTEVGPFHHGNVAVDLSRAAGETLDLQRILAAVCDDVSVSRREGGEWVELTKRVERTEGPAA
jgi:hypothetical protein